MRRTSLLSTIVLATSAAFAAGAVDASPATTAARSAGNTTVAVIPAQWYSADAESAQRLTEGIRNDFVARGWDLVPEETVRNAAQTMGLKNGIHYPDETIMRLGRSLHVNLVVYPRLLALGVPVAAATPDVRLIDPAAVVHVRVLDVTRKRALYCNQIAHEFNGDGMVDLRAFALPAPECRAAATEALGGFFTPRVAGRARLRAAQARLAFRQRLRRHDRRLSRPTA